MQKTRLLLIDDDKDFLETMQDILETESYELSAFTEAADISLMVAQLCPDIVLLDYGLKKTTGGELCRQLRSNRKLAYLPIVLISAFPEYMLPLESVSYSVFVPKPFDLWEFLACLDELRLQVPYASLKGNIPQMLVNKTYKNKIYNNIN